MLRDGDGPTTLSDLADAVAGVGVLVTLGVLLALPPFTWLGPLAWAPLTVAAFATVAPVQLYYHPLFPERFGAR